MTVDDATELAAKYAPNAMPGFEKRVRDLIRRLASCDASKTRLSVLVYEWASGF